LQNNNYKLIEFIGGGEDDVEVTPQGFATPVSGGGSAFESESGSRAVRSDLLLERYEEKIRELDDRIARFETLAIAASNAAEEAQSHAIRAERFSNIAAESASSVAASVPKEARRKA
jgi:hypothetical protein